jgi:YVTN family beta-propeller protein
MGHTESVRRSTKPTRVLATVLFTDIVGSTELAASLGDRRWRTLVARHHAAVRSELKRHHGREIDTAGDGFFALFTSPAEAIACAVAINAAIGPLDLRVRAGLHTGEVETSGSDVGGIAVHTGARVAATAGAGEIVVTSMVKDLVAGSGIEFADRGVTELKGIDGDWHLYSVIPATPAPGAASPQAAQPATARRSAARIVVAAAAIGLVAIVGVALVVPRLLAGPLIPEADTVGRLPRDGSAYDLVVGVGARPTGVVAGEGSVFVINFQDATLSRIDPAAGESVANPAVGGTPTGVAYGHGSVWVTTGLGLSSGGEGQVVRFDRQMSIVDRIDVGSGIEAIASGGGAVWVADRLDDVVLRIDPATGAVGAPYPVGRAPGAIAYGAGSVWVTSTLDDALLRLDPLTGSVVATIPLLAAPTSIAVIDQAVWVTSDVGDSLTLIDPATNTIRTTITALDGPRGVAATPEAVWVAVAGTGDVVRIDPATNEVDLRLAVEGLPDGVAVDEAGAAWVSVHAP